MMRGFSSNQHHGPSVNCVAGADATGTQSTRSATAMMQPKSTASGIVGNKWANRRILSIAMPAWIASGPRYLVGHDRFSTALSPFAIAHAHGCLMVSAFIRLLYRIW
jgi:hypothetical protein